MRNSQVIKSQEEIRAEMKDAGSTRADIDAAIDQMKAAEKAVSEEYQNISPEYVKALAKS